MLIPYGDEFSRPQGRRTATWAILLINLLVFLLVESPVFSNKSPFAEDKFFLKYGLVPAFVNLPANQKTVHVKEQVPILNPENGEVIQVEKSLVWRPSQPHWLPLGFLSSLFLHGDFSHIAGNMLFFWIFAHNVEDALGPLNFLLLYLGCGFIAGVAEVLLHPHSVIPVIGASGAIAGLLGAYVVLFPRNLIKTFYWIFFFWGTTRIPAFYYIGFWFLMQLFLSVGERAVNFTGVAYMAHVGGFLAGILLIFLLPKRQEVMQYYRYLHRQREWRA